MKLQQIGLHFACLAFSVSAFAEVQERMFESVRANSRGRTYVAGFDSDEATHLNPATVGETNITFQLRPFQFDGFIGTNVIDSINDITSLASSSSMDGTNILDTFGSKFGKRQALRGQLSLLAMRFGHHEINFFASENARIALHNDVFPYFDWMSDAVAGGSWTSSFMVKPNLFVGATMRLYQRYYIAGEISSTQMTSFLSSSVSMDDIIPVSSGLGLGVDLGMIYRFNPMTRIGMVVSDVGDSGYLSKGTTHRPPLVRQRVDIGLLHRIQVTQNLQLDSFVDYQDLLNRDGLSMLRLLKLGSEFGAKWFGRENDMGITAGISEGWVSGGIFMDFYLFRIDFATYGVEVGHSPGQKQDKTYALSLKTSMTF